VRAAGPGTDGTREFSVHARPDADAPWTLHAAGTFTTSPATPPAALPWPPRDTPHDVGDLYERLADRGYGYGPLFQGLRAVWRDGDIRFAEIELPSGTDTAGYGIHPALLDAALHPLLLDDRDDRPVPFSVTGATWHSAARGPLRVVLAPLPGQADAYRLTLTAVDGTPIADIESLAVRPLPAGLTSAAPSDSFFTLGWTRSGGESAGETGNWAGIGVGLDDLVPQETRFAVPDALEGSDDALLISTGGGGDPAEATAAVLEVLRVRLADKRSARTPLLVVTRNAVSVGGEDVTDLAGAAVRGLVRSAQAENPGRLVMVDLDGDPASPRALGAVLASGEPEAVIRAGAVHLPRLARAVPGRAGSPLGGGTVLVTGGTGTLGARIARHLVTAHGVTRLVLAGRRGPAAPGTADLLAELAALGAEATAVACDVSDRSSLARLLACIEDLDAIVHTAGVVDDGVLTSLDADRIAAVFRPKADAAWNLHELTKDRPLTAFVLFSSLAGTLGTAGQANYSAANAYLDALAAHRTALGLPATSIVWGLWEAESAMTGDLSEADFARVARTGILPLAESEGLSLFDAALAHGVPVVVAAKTDPPALRARAADGTLPPVLSGLVRAVTKRPERQRPIGERLAGLDAEGRLQALLDLVRESAAAVLGHASADLVAPDRGFTEIGFDSLTGVELRNRLSSATGLQLSATLVFDHPTAAALAELLNAELAPPSPSATLLAELDRLEAGLAETPPDEDDRSRLAARLQDLLVNLGNGEGSGGPARFAASSDDEIFDFIDNELGIA
jgi:polyketide synthase 12